MAHTRTQGGEWLRKARIHAGLSIREAARARGCSVSTVKKWEHVGVPGGTTTGMVIACAKAYRVSADDMLAHTDTSAW